MNLQPFVDACFLLRFQRERRPTDADRRKVAAEGEHWVERTLLQLSRTGELQTLNREYKALGPDRPA